MTAPEILTIEVDCHAYPFHLPDPEYPECGPDNLVRMAETYGILIRHLPDHAWAHWAWWYEITGPREHLVRFMNEEYGCDDADQMITDSLG